MSWTCSQPSPKAQETRKPSTNRKLNGRVLGKELITHLELVLAEEGDVKRGANAVARWLFDEGLIKQCTASQRSFEVEQVYSLCRYVEPNLWDGRRKDFIEKAEFLEKAIVRMKQTHKVEVECLKSAKDKLAVELDVLKNELDRLRSLRSSDVVKNKKKNSKLVEVEEGETLEKNAPKLPESMPPPPPLPDSSQSPPPPLAVVPVP